MDQARTEAHEPNTYGAAMTQLAEMRRVWDDNQQHAHHEGNLDGAGLSFQAIGVKTWDMLGCFGGTHILEWGVGGGANPTALGKNFETYVGVDIAPKSLTAAANACPRIEPFLLASYPDTFDLGRKFDTVISTACFQHFPNKEYGIEVVWALVRHMTDDGHGLIQTRYYEPGDVCDPIDPRRLEQPYSERFIRSNAYQVAEFWKILEVAGLTVQDVTLERAPQYGWYRFHK